ncbi:MAG: hypothetical protein ACI85O_001196, partial [Saprospiraceae bacterium]
PSCPNPFSQPGGYDLGNMGLNIQTDESNSLGGDIITIRRGHTSTIIDDSSSISKYWKVIRQDTSNNDIDITASFFTPEATGQDTDNLNFYYSPATDGTGIFSNQGISTHNMNSASLDDVDTLAGTWTLQTCISPTIDIPYPNNEVHFCQSEATEITLSPVVLPEEGSYTYLWQKDNVTIGMAATLTIPFDATVDFATYLFTAVNEEGCKSAENINVYFYQTPQVDWSEVPSFQCSLDPFTINGSVLDDEMMSYSWILKDEEGIEVDFGDNNESYTFTPLASGIYTICLTKGYFAESALCPEIFTHTITFVEDPVEVSFSYPFGEIDVCEAEGTYTIIPDITPADDGTYTYAWTLNDIIVGTDTIYTVVFNPEIEFEIYQLTVTMESGCSDDASIDVYHTESADVDWSNLPAIICTLDPYTFNAGWGNAGAGFQWSVDGIIQQEEFDSTFVFMPLMAGTYEIRVVTAEYGGIQYCPETFTHTITFSEEPVELTFPYPFNEVYICETEGSFTLESNVSPVDDGFYTYQWILDEIVVGTDATLIVNYDAAIEFSNYQLIVTTSEGCTDDEMITVYHTESADVDWSALPTTLCTLTPYTFNAGWGNAGAGFQWSVDDMIQEEEFDSTFVFMPLMAGTYEISVITAEYGGIQYCPETFTHTITFSDGEQLADLPFTMSACDVEGGTTPINLETPACTDCTYQWLDAMGNLVGTNSNTYTVPDLTENTTYSVEVTKDDCTSTDEISLLYYFVAIDEVATTITDLECDGLPTGSIDLVFDATQLNNIAISWEHVDTGETYFTEDLTDLAAGTYAVTVTDELNGCIDTATFIVGGSNEMLTATSVVVQPNCFGEDNGSITLMPSGGTEMYTYAWSHGPMTVAVTDLAPDMYTVTIFDGNDCEYIESFNIIEPILLEVSLEKTDLNCAGDTDGTITVSTTGGTEPYTYIWSANANNPIDPENLTDLSGGIYTVTVTDERGCEVITSITIEEPTNAITASFAPTTQGISCNNISDGFISIIANGGTGILTYDWNVDTYDGMSEVNNLPAGMYSISVSDENGCPPVVLDITFDNPSILTLLDISTNPTAAGAMDGSINITVEGGTPDYNYDWADVPGLNNDEDRTELGQGSYTVIVTDENGCEITQQYQLTEPGQISVILESITNISCEGIDDGAIDITVNGGVLPYDFLWSNGAMTEDLLNVPAGNYTVMITDDNGVEFTSLTYTVNLPVFLTDNAIITQIDCSEETGIIALNPTNGTGDYTYAWQHGPMTATVTDLMAGDYTVTISTENECPFVGTYTINTAPTEILVLGSITGVCAGNMDGAIDIIVSGGTPDYSFIWTNIIDGSIVGLTEDMMNLAAGDYQVEVTDANDCVKIFDFNIPEYPALAGTAVVTDISAGGATDGAIDLTITGGTEDFIFAWSNADGFMADTEDISNLGANIYTVLVTDDKGCTFTDFYNVNEIGALEINLDITQAITCFGLENGSISLEIEGGTMPYTILWSNEETTEIINDLEPGVYSVTVTDDTGFSINTSIEIIAPEEFSLTEIPTGVACNGDGNGSISIIVNNGQSPFNFLWSNEATTQNISELIAGIYTVTATDNNDCETTQTATVSTPDILELTVDIIENPNCWDETDGTISLNTIGGTGAYEYAWSNGEMIEDIINLSPDTYLVTVTDENNCTAEMSYEITAPLPILISLDQTNINCGGAAVGSITATVTGGTTASGDYNLMWSNGETTLEITDLLAGNYTLTAEDDNGCTSVESGIIMQTGSLELSEIQTNITCFGEEDGLILVQIIDNGTAPFDYIWSNGETTDLVTSLAAQEYSVTVTDTEGCEGIETYDISEPTPIIGTLNDIATSCFNSENGGIELTVSGGTLEAGNTYSYLWSNAETTEDLNNLSGGVYTVTITDDNNCQLIETETVISPDEITITALQGGTDCGGTNNISISLEVAGGTPDYLYNWNNGTTTPTIENLTFGTYTVTVTDANGCTQNIEQVVIQPEPIEASAFIQRAGCKADNDGLIDVTTIGGLEPYEYIWSNGSFEEDVSGLSVGNYALTITDAGNCEQELTFEVQMAPEPFSVNFLVNSGLSDTDTLQVNSSDIVQFIDVTSPTPIAWEWFFGDPNNSTSTERNPQFSYPFDEDMEQTEYLASMIASNEFCRDTVTKTILIINNFRPNIPTFDSGENVRFLSVNAYPNPTSNQVILDIEMSKETEVSVQIVDILGRVHEERILTGEEKYSTEFSLQKLIDGVYYIHLHSADRNVTLGIVKVN